MRERRWGARVRTRQTYEGTEILDFQGYRVVRIIWDDEPVVLCQTARNSRKVNTKRCTRKYSTSSWLTSKKRVRSNLNTLPKDRQVNKIVGEDHPTGQHEGRERRRGSSRGDCSKISAVCHSSLQAVKLVLKSLHTRQLTSRLESLCRNVCRCARVRARALVCIHIATDPRSK